jgi:membrane-associated phospholipid phosphatase
MRRFVPRLSVFVFFLAAAAVPIAAQSSVAPTPNQTPAYAQRSLEKDFLKHIAHDQVHIWTSPFRRESYDTTWTLAVGLGTSALIASDEETSSWVKQGGNLAAVSHAISWGGTGYVTGGTAAAFYLAGRATHNYKARETGILAAQALIDAGIVTEALKLATQRERPNSGDGDGHFWAGGSSFPSGHSTAIWSLATVVSYEYKDKPLIKYGAFAAAAAVSASRYTGREHFLSDIFVGSLIGWSAGRYVFKEYHEEDPGLTPAKKITNLIPQFTPYYNGRSRTYGGSLAWHL